MHAGVACRQSDYFFFSSRRRHTRCSRDWSSDVCSSDLLAHRRSLLSFGGLGVDAAQQVELPSQVPEGRSGTEIPPFSAQGPSRSLGEELEEFVGGAEMTQDAEARMAVLIAIGLDDAPVVVAAHGVGLEAWHDSYIPYACAIVKADRNRLWWGSKHSKYGISRAFGDGAVRFERK